MESEARESTDEAKCRLDHPETSATYLISMNLNTAIIMGSSRSVA